MMNNEDKIGILKKTKIDLLNLVRNSSDKIDDIDPLYSMMKDGIIGFAVGDALGVPIEFKERKKLQSNPLREMIGFGSHFVPAGTWSDDTSMVLATMDSIIKNESINYNDIMHNFLMWYQFAKYTATFVTFDVGNATKKAILKYSDGTKANFCGSKRPDDNGNGSLMRMLPVVYYLYVNDFTDEEEVEIINSISSLTHAHEVSCLGCKIYCDYVKQLLKGNNKVDALNYVSNYPYNKYYSEKSIYKYRSILSGEFSKLSMNDIKSTGYVIHTLGASLWCLLNSDNYEDTVVKAVNLGGDTDTIGAITGSLAGIMYGNKQIPRRWLYVLKRRGYLQYISNKFIGVLKTDTKNKLR